MNDQIIGYYHHHGDMGFILDRPKKTIVIIIIIQEFSINGLLTKTFNTDIPNHDHIT